MGNLVTTLIARFAFARLASLWRERIHATGYIGFLASRMAGRGGPAPAGIRSVIHVVLFLIYTESERIDEPCKFLPL